MALFALGEQKVFGTIIHLDVNEQLLADGC